MLNAMTAEARTALQVAHKVALTLGRREIDAVAMVAAMLAMPHGVAGRALAQFSLTGKQFLARARPDAAPVQEGAERFTPFAPEVKAALDAAARDALGTGRLQITSGDILLGLVAHDGRIARILAELGAPPELIPSAVAEMAPPALTLGQVVADLPLPAPPELPTARSRLARLGGLGLAYLAAFGLATLALPGPVRLLAGAGYLAVVVVDGVIQVLLTGVGARRVERRLAKRVPTVVAPPPVVTHLVHQAGVRRFVLRVSTGRLIQDRAYRLGRSACVVVSAVTIIESESLPFVLAHEIGHVVRRDSGHHRASFIMAASMVVIPLVAPAPLPLVVALLAGAVVFVADRWRAEYACDAFAVRWVGADPLRLWMTTYARRLARPENRTPRRRLRRALGRLTHPPIAWRMARAERLARAPGDDSPGGPVSRRSRPGRTPGLRRTPWPRRSPAPPADPDAGSSRTQRASG